MSYQISWPIIPPKRKPSDVDKTRSSTPTQPRPNIFRKQKVNDGEIIEGVSATSEDSVGNSVDSLPVEVVDADSEMQLVEIINEEDFPHQYVVEGQIVEEVVGVGMTELYIDGRGSDPLNDSSELISINLARADSYKKAGRSQRYDTDAVQLPCVYCSKTFKVRANLIRHIRMHNGDRPFGCEVCGYTFTQQANLQKHMLIHTGVRPFGCHYCEKRFTQRANLVKHVRTHTGVRPYKCTVCEKAFTQQTNLDKHLRIHTGVKPYVCGVCDKGFAQQNNLVKHLYTHETIKPYRCQNCDKSYTQKINLQLHEKKCIKITVII